MNDQNEAIETTGRIPRIVGPDGAEAVATEVGICADCGCAGLVSDWPGRGALCAAADDGRLICDDCAELEAEPEPIPEPVPCTNGIGYDCHSGGYLPEWLIAAVASAIAEAHDDGVSSCGGGAPLANWDLDCPLWSSEGERSARHRAVEALKKGVK